MQTIVDVDDEATIKFYWKVSSEQGGDYLQFYIDGSLQDQICGEHDWAPKSYTISTPGPHTLKWRYVKDDGGTDGEEDCGWVDFIRWSGPGPDQVTENWDTIVYKYDPDGRRIEKKIDGISVRYCYDGDQVIAEYDGNNNLLRKYIYGLGIDEPVCMIDVEDDDAVYYYHFDGLGSVIALSDDEGDTVQTYKYSVFGLVAATDNSHPNPYMFTGRRYDKEIGLYYYRARYYNPYIGRFLQTDPVGYEAGMNLYLYCMNNPLNMLDPMGRCPSESNSVSVCEICENFDVNDYNNPDEPMQTGQSGKYKYTWGGTYLKAKALCCLAVLVTCPLTLSADAAVASEGLWCATMTRPCIVWCYSEKVPASKQEYCASKCKEEFDRCYERSKKGKCTMKFKIEFN